MSLSAGRLRILAVGMCPPPYLGQALAFLRTVEPLRQWHQVTIINTQFQRSISEFGLFSIAKVVIFLRLFLTKIIPLILQERFDLLYYTPSSASQLGLLKDLLYLTMLRLLCRATVYHFHGTGGMAIAQQSNFIIRSWARIALFRPELAIRCADVVPNDAAICGARTSTIIFNGIFDPASCSPQKNNFSRPGTLVLTFVGAVIREKGAYDLIKIASLLKAKGYDLLLNIVGHSSDHDLLALRALIAENSLTEEVHLTGIVSDEDKFRLLSETTVFVFPTYFQAETQPAAVIEALAMGVPAVTSDWRGLNTIVEDGVNGYLVPPRRPDLFAAAVERVISREGTGEMRAAARRSFLERFTFDRYIRELNSALVTTAEQYARAS